jgi:hypothetical protein
MPRGLDSHLSEHGGEHGPAQLAVQDAARSLGIDRVTAQLVDALDGAGVPCIVLKGPSVALWLYDAAGARSYCDSDILVPPFSLAAAESILRSLGFWSPLDGAADDEHEDHAIPWLRARDGACIDLHTTLGGLRGRAARVWAVLDRRTQNMSVGGRDVRVLDPAARALHLALHAAQSGVASPKPLHDLARGLQRLPREVWVDAADLAATLDGIDAFACGLRLLPEGVELADGLRLPDSIPVRVALRATTPPPLALGFATLCEMTGLRSRCRFVVHKLLPSRAYVRFHFPRARRGRFGMWLGYGQRWLWIARRSPIAYRAWRRVSRDTRSA